MNARRIFFFAVCWPAMVVSCTSMRPQRLEMVNTIRDQVSDVPVFRQSPYFGRALDAVGAVPRERFVRPALRRDAYAERPQSIGYDQTISDPYIVAIMTAAVEVSPQARVLEVGTGSGYQAAILSHLAREVYSIEIVEPLARESAARLRTLRYSNVHVRAGDGFAGWPEAAPYNAILVTAGAAEPPRALLDQLAPGGRLVMPVGPSGVQERLIVYRKGADGALSRCVLGSAMFVPLTGQGARPKGSMGLEERGLAYCYGADLGRWTIESPAKR